MIRIKKKKVLPQKKNLLLKLINLKKNGYFNLNFKLIQPLHLSYATLVTYVPVLGAKQFQFPWNVIFNDFAQTLLNWFLLLFQTAKPSTQKMKLCCCPQGFLMYIFLFNYCDNGCLTEEHT